MADIKITLPAEVDGNNPIVGDLFLENGTCRLTNTLMEEVAQEIWIRFRFIMGEWFLDRTVGIPWLRLSRGQIVAILGEKTPIGIVNQMLKRVVTTCPGVQTLLAFRTARLVGRGYGVTFACRLTDGAILKSADFGPFTVGV